MVQYNNVKALDSFARARRGQHTEIILDSGLDKTTVSPYFRDSNQYFTERAELSFREASLGFEWMCKQKATPEEVRANNILQILKHNDEVIYGSEPPRQGYGGQKHGRFSGDHFLSNRDLIERTDVFRLASRMPKGGHLHIHFNTNLKPTFLLDIAKSMPRMFISSDRPLLEKEDFKLCNIQFLIRSVQAEELDGVAWDIFTADYEPARWMRFDQFRSNFHEYSPLVSVDQWLQGKLVFTEEEVHDPLQTTEGQVFYIC